MATKISSVLIVSVLVFGLMGAGRGLDEGTISGCLTQPSFKNQFGLTGATKSMRKLAELKSNITAMVQLGSVLGALLALLICDRLGRVRSLQVSILIWLSGTILQVTTFTSSIIQISLGRLISGVGLGMTAVICPTYLTEVAPQKYRGLCNCLYSGSVYLGIMLGYFANWGTTVHISNHSRNQWVIPMSLQLILGGSMAIASPFVCESPRWLFKHGQDKKGIEVLAAIRLASKEDTALGRELGQIYAHLAKEKQEALSKTEVFINLFSNTAIRFRLILGLLVQLFGQWSGANAVTMYAPDMFTLVGVSDQNTRMFYTSIFGVVKLIASLASGLFVIDKLGRKRALYIGISLQAVSLLYICVFFIARNNFGEIPAIQRTAVGTLIMLYTNGVGWALGWNSVQYLINSEMFPIAFRTMGCGFIMCFHFVNQYANSRATPFMLLAFKGWGTMLFFCVVCLLGLMYAFWLIPELTGMSLETIDDLFENPWFKIGRISRTSDNKKHRVQNQPEGQSHERKTIV